VHVIIVADGDPPDRDALDAAWPGWDAGAELVVAADGGVRGAFGLGRPPDLVVGDLDSIAPTDLARLTEARITVDRSPVDKDETDSELAVLAAVGRGASRLTILGAFGGPRLDHELANLALLALPALVGRLAVLLDPRARVSLLEAPASDGGRACRELPGPVGTLVSLLPFGAPAVGVTTTGLRYQLTDETLPVGPARGLSNVRSATAAAVCLGDGRLLIVESPASLLPSTHDR
jgi:thiamine pyrophosphokinase